MCGCQGSTDVVESSCNFFVGSHSNMLWCERVIGKSSSFKGEMSPNLVDSHLKEIVYESFKKGC